MWRPVGFPSPIRRNSHEKNLPALTKASCPPVRFPGSHGDEERSRDHQSASGGRPETSRGRWNEPEVRAAYAGLIPGGSDSVLTLTSFLAQASAESLPRARIIRRRAVFDATRNKGRRVSNRWMALNFIARDAVKSGETGSVA